MAQLFIKDADGSPTVYELTGTCTIGRHPDNTVVLNHASVSVNHAEIFFHDGSFLLKDLLSSNGTFVNGGKVIMQQLKDGDQIKFGNVDAVVSIETAHEPVHEHPPRILNDPADY